MRKNLASHAEVAHYWANNTQAEGKCGNMFFEGDLIYSYGHHFVIARRTDQHDEHGTPIVLVNSHHYSKTTARHISLTCQAASHYRRITVPYPATGGDIQRSNMEYLNGEVTTAIARLKKAKTHLTWKETAIREAVADAATYHAVFAPDCQTQPVPLPEDFDAILDAARERERVFNLPPTDEVLKKRAADREKRRIQAEKKALAEQADAIARWRTGESVYSLRGVPVMLRLAVDGDDVVTSLGARVPVDHARRLFAIIKKCRKTGKVFQANGKTISIGVYKVQSIDAAGTLTAGCHVISWEEIERFAKSQGWEV